MAKGKDLKLSAQIEDVDGEYRDVPKMQLHLERLEAAGVQVLTQRILDKSWDDAEKCLELLERVGIV